MTKQLLQLRCKNNKKTLKIAVGSTLSEVFSVADIKMAYAPVCAKVNNRVVGMHYRLYNDKDIEFMGIDTDSGSRTYTRTLFFVCCKAINDIFPQAEVRIDISVSKGYFVDMRIGREVTAADTEQVRRRMEEIIAARIPIKRHMVPTEEAVRLFTAKGDMSKVKLLNGLGSLYTVYYQIEDFIDYFYGALMTNTADIHLFGLEPFNGGMLLRVPSPENPAVLCDMPDQRKMFEIFKEHHRWQDIMGLKTVGR